MSMSFPFLFYNASDMKNLFSAILFFTIIAPVCEAATTDVVYKDKSVIATGFIANATYVQYLYRLYNISLYHDFGIGE